MANDSAARWPDLVFSGDATTGNLSRAVRRGTLRRVTRGVYTGDLRSDLQEVTRRHLWPIVAHEMPGAVIADRSVPAGGLPSDGALYVVHSRRNSLQLPGVTVYPRTGPRAVEGDMALPEGLWMSSTERALLDNLAAHPDDARWMTRTEVEEWIERLLQQRGEEGLNRLRDKARAASAALGRDVQMSQLDLLIAAALRTRTVDELVSPALYARAAGIPYDDRRIRQLEKLAGTLASLPPDVLADRADLAERRTLLPFYEAYFSNFIEGTEFTLDEASEIVFEQHVLTDRPKDSHDILGTYELVSDVDEMARTPRDADDLVATLKARHSVLMARRPEALPGQFKTRANRAGLTEFVAPDLVEGTLRRGWEIAGELRSPFSRAVYMMFLVAEIHPFVDGNGRIARIMMNAELVGHREVRIIVPTVYRANYLSALKAASHTDNFDALVATLAFARKYTARIDFTNRATAEADLARTNAFLDAHDAEENGIRLVLP
ncbi:MAG: Fic family protein [Stackebrandtia sp.]